MAGSPHRSLPDAARLLSVTRIGPLDEDLDLSLRDLAVCLRRPSHLNVVIWDLGVVAVGHANPLDFVRCRRCGRRAPLPAWFGLDSWSLEAECQKCISDRATMRPSDPCDHATKRPPL